MERLPKDAKVSQESLGQLDQGEIDLIHWIRNRFRYGQIVVEVRDGKPYRINKVTEYQTLG